MCTGIFIKTKDGKFIFARTLEFGVYLKWKQFCSLNIKGTIGHFQNVKQGFMTDGLNSNGLFVGTFFFPHNDNQYPKKEDPNKIELLEYKKSDKTKKWILGEKVANPENIMEYIKEKYPK